jgi:AraC-like DNA-binding protein
MHDWDTVASDAFAAIFRGGERAPRVRFQFRTDDDSKDCQMQRARSGHDARASKEGLSSMNPAQKALWFIESHLAGALSLDEIAGVAGISRFHMVRAFAAATGLPVMRYVRVRRLTEAARARSYRRATAELAHSSAPSSCYNRPHPPLHSCKLKFYALAGQSDADDPRPANQSIIACSLG